MNRKNIFKLINMKALVTNKIQFILLFVSLFSIFSCGKKGDSSTEIKDGTNNFNYGWKFLKDSTEGAENPTFADSSWRTVDLPHDWSIEDLDKTNFPDAVGAFTKKSEGGIAIGHFKGGIAWYRKHFKLNSKDKEVSISFDGVYMLAEVWVNGKLAGKNNNGYSPFNFNITSLLNSEGSDNIIAVRVKNQGKNSRWYSGSGIYRNVCLHVQNKINIQIWGVYITTPQISKEKASVIIQTTLKNTENADAKISFETKITNKGNKEVIEIKKDTSIAANSESVVKLSVTIKNPVLWSCETPNLYTVEQLIKVNNEIVENKETTFGIRSLEFSAEKGFLLNGVETKLNGGCMHHDNGILGSATFEDAEVHRIKAMKDNGFNAIRTSHNPPSKAFLDACDRMGMLVIDEAFDMWERPKNPQDYHLYFKTDAKKDLQAMLLRDRNHPSIIIWSIGNEINERADTSGVRIGNWLKGIVKELDTTRPVTAAICMFWDHPTYTWKNSIPAFEVLDVHGYNYQWKEYENDIKNFPNRIIIGTETTAAESLDNYNLMKKQKNVIGEFIWTGMDYFGESGIGHYYNAKEPYSFSMPYPFFNAWCGDIDVIGNKKMQSYYRDVIWNRSKMEIAVHSPENDYKTEKISYWGWANETLSWNWQGSEGKKLRVNIYTRCDKVKLELNGKLIAEKQITEKDRLTATFEVPYEAGELKATGYENGKEVVSKSLKTTGKPAKLRLVPEKNSIVASKANLAYFRVEVIDNQGQVIPLSQIPVSFKISGEASLAAAGTACPNCMESFTDNTFTTYNGLGIIILRSTGKTGTLKVEAKANGLETAIAEIKAE